MNLQQHLSLLILSPLHFESVLWPVALKLYLSAGYLVQLTTSENEYTSAYFTTTGVLIC